MDRVSMAAWPGWWLASVVARTTGKRASYAALPRRRALASVVLVASLAALAGAIVGGAFALHDTRAAALPAELCFVGAAWAGLAAALVRLTARGSGKDAGRQLVALVCAYAGWISLLLSGRAIGLAALATSAALASAAAARRRLPVTPPLGGV